MLPPLQELEALTNSLLYKLRAVEYRQSVLTGNWSELTDLAECERKKSFTDWAHFTAGAVQVRAEHCSAWPCLPCFSLAWLAACFKGRRRALQAA